MVTPVIVKQYAPELEPLDDFKVQLYIDMAKVNVAESFFGTAYDQALSMLTCHYLTMAGGSSNTGPAPGPVTSKSVGDLSVGYGSAEGWKSDGSLRTTEYGRIYLHIRNSIPRSPIVSGNY